MNYPSPYSFIYSLLLPFLQKNQSKIYKTVFCIKKLLIKIDFLLVVPRKVSNFAARMV